MVEMALRRERPDLSHPYQPPVQADRYYLKLIKHTGALIFWQQRSYSVYGTLPECEAAYRSAQTYNLLAGWWSLLSLLLFNWIALISNANAMRQLRNAVNSGGQAPAAPVPASRPASAPVSTPVSMPAGWYPDPHGAGQRYWDGTTWTNWTHPPRHR
ncbi:MULTISPECIES: DUF2510 domain-containing protein [Mycobacterium ulcerans group]|nr:MULTISPECIES: DUF2510 domain-containing protein [Mycobacterium ulcerans group]